MKNMNPKSNVASSEGWHQRLVPHFMSKKLKNYEVTVSAFATVLVIAAENEEKALEYATGRVSFGDLQMDEAEVKREIKTADELEACRRHADVVAEDE